MRLTWKQLLKLSDFRSGCRRSGRCAGTRLCGQTYHLSGDGPREMQLFEIFGCDGDRFDGDGGECGRC